MEKTSFHGTTTLTKAVYLHAFPVSRKKDSAIVKTYCNTLPAAQASKTPQKLGARRKKAEEGSGGNQMIEREKRIVYNIRQEPKRRELA
ncbi:MAG: hypothetical protein IKQ45_07585 [Clostridia bacterium]|nr:hypothetical protein [Clostridia bacterium]